MIKKPSKMILTAGPARSRFEIRYVSDAVKNGWNFHHSDYIKKFEKAFAKYLSVRYALAVSTGTSALHLALVLAGVGLGDEVIIPDMTYVACSNAVYYTGAKPVLVEIDKETWTIDVTKLEKQINKKTKAIMPVHLYGNAANLTSINRIAKKHKLFIIEDACQGLGCRLNGKQLGSFGDAAAFSFQGAKLLAIGEGGMLVTNRKNWYERAVCLADHGVSPIRQFWHDEIGFMYPMSNIQAALGLARLKEIDNLIKKKRQIFFWYKQRLGKIAGLSLNPERAELFSSYWMSSITLDGDFGISRDEVRKKLREAMIDTRSFFYPISLFGFYGKEKINNPEAYRVSLNSINLPSGVTRTEAEIDYVCRTLTKILRV